MFTIIYSIIIIVLFFILRELFCWYWKINERITLQTETNNLLKDLINVLSNNTETYILNNPLKTDNFKAPQVPVEKVGDLANYADEFKRYIGEDPSRAALQERLSKMDTSAAEEERVAPWMALAQAGFGMAAGKSPYALTNIGEGALAGIKSYGDAKDKLDKLEEKHFDLSNDLAKSQRAETIAEAKYGADSKQAAENRAQTANIHNQAINTQLQIAKINASVTGATKLVSERLAAEAKATARFQLLYGKDAAIAGDPTLQSKYNQILMEEYKNAGIPLSSTSGVNSPANDLSKWTVKPK